MLQGKSMRDAWLIIPFSRPTREITMVKSPEWHASSRPRTDHLPVFLGMIRGKASTSTWSLLTSLALQARNMCDRARQRASRRPYMIEQTRIHGNASRKGHPGSKYYSSLASSRCRSPTATYLLKACPCARLYNGSSLVILHLFDCFSDLTIS